MPHHLRPMLQSDLSAVTTIASSAFISQPDWDITHPHRYQYPLSWRAMLSRGTRRRFFAPAMWGIVCVSDDDPEKVLGYAFWERCGPAQSANSKGRLSSSSGVAGGDAEAMTDPWSERNTSLWIRLNNALSRLETRYYGMWRENSARDYVAVDQVGSLNLPSPDDLLDPLTKVATYWYLSLLAVDPDQQRRGIGTLLSKWGLDRATDENVTRDPKSPVAVALAASTKGMGLYRKMGFKDVDWAVAPKDLMSERPEDMPVMVWDETETWVVPAKEGRTASGMSVSGKWSEQVLAGGSSPAVINIDC